MLIGLLDRQFASNRTPINAFLLLLVRNVDMLVDYRVFSV